MPGAVNNPNSLSPEASRTMSEGFGRDTLPGKGFAYAGREKQKLLDKQPKAAPRGMAKSASGSAKPASAGRSPGGKRSRKHNIRGG